MPRSYDRAPSNLATTNSHFLFRLLSPMENASFAGEGRTGATSDSPARNGIRRSATPRRRTAPPLRTTGCLNEPESTLPYWLSDFLVRRVLAHRCTSQRIGFTRFKRGPQAHRPLRFVCKNNFDPWAAPNFREAQLFVELCGPVENDGHGRALRMLYSRVDQKSLPAPAHVVIEQVGS